MTFAFISMKATTTVVCSRRKSKPNYSEIVPHWTNISQLLFVCVSAFFFCCQTNVFSAKETLNLLKRWQEFPFYACMLQICHIRMHASCFAQNVIRMHFLLVAICCTQYFNMFPFKQSKTVTTQTSRNLRFLHFHINSMGVCMHLCSLIYKYCAW